MKKRVCVGLLILSILLGVVAHPIYASNLSVSDDSIYDPVRVQDLTGPRYEGVKATNWQDDMVIYSTLNGQLGVMDVFGNSVLEPADWYIHNFAEGYFCISKNDKQAMFYKSTQLTPFRYVEMERALCGFRGKVYENESYEFLDMNGKVIPLPSTIPADFEVINIVPNAALLLRKEATYRYDAYLGGYVQSGPYYQVVDWQGNALSKVYDSTIYFRDKNSFVISRSSGDIIRYLDESKAENEMPNGFYNAAWTENPDNQYRILCKTEMSGKSYYLFDTEYNQICKLDVRTNADIPVRSLSVEHFIISKTDGSSVVMNAKGEEVAQVQGTFVSLVGVEHFLNVNNYSERFVTCDSVNSYLYSVDGTLIAVLNGATWVENQGCYIIGEFGNGVYVVYDYDGNVLFEYNSASGIMVVNGVILHETQNGCAILDKNGNAITEVEFGVVQKLWGVYGVVYGNVLGREGVFLINNRGEVLNPEGFDEYPSISGNKDYCAYKIDGKTGFLRFVSPGDDLFLDVPSGEWYHDAVEACAELELFNGTGAAKFSPEDTMTRAMLVTVLWRLDGKKTPKETVVFTDVPEDTWYTEAVAWAAENGIVNGVGDEKFEPEGSVTREQIATIFCRYAESKGIDTQKRADLSSYPDVAEISDYAKEAMAWVNAEGLIIGNKIGETVLLQPQGDATRAQVATIFVRFVNTFIEN